MNKFLPFVKYFVNSGGGENMITRLGIDKVTEHKLWAVGVFIR